MNDKIEVRMGNGLSIIEPGETDVIIIAGMGAGTMIEILEASLETAQKARKLILQPMAGASSLRRWVNANGWRIDDEVLVEEGRHLYEIIYRSFHRLIPPVPAIKCIFPDIFHFALLLHCGTYSTASFDIDRIL